MGNCSSRRAADVRADAAPTEPIAAEQDGESAPAAVTPAREVTVMVPMLASAGWAQRAAACSRNDDMPGGALEPSSFPPPFAPAATPGTPSTAHPRERSKSFAYPDSPWMGQRNNTSMLYDDASDSMSADASERLPPTILTSRRLAARDRAARTAAHHGHQHVPGGHSRSSSRSRSSSIQSGRSSRRPSSSPPAQVDETPSRVGMPQRQESEGQLDIVRSWLGSLNGGSAASLDGDDDGEEEG